MGVLYAKLSWRILSQAQEHEMTIRSVVIILLGGFSKWCYSASDRDSWASWLCGSRCRENSK